MRVRWFKLVSILISFFHEFCSLKCHFSDISAVISLIWSHSKKLISEKCLRQEILHWNKTKLSQHIGRIFLLFLIQIRVKGWIWELMTCQDEHYAFQCYITGGTSLLRNNTDLYSFSALSPKRQECVSVQIPKPENSDIGDKNKWAFVLSSPNSHLLCVIDYCTWSL